MKNKKIIKLFVLLILLISGTMSNNVAASCECMASTNEIPSGSHPVSAVWRWCSGK